MKKKVVLAEGVYFIIDENGVIECNQEYVMISNDIHIRSHRMNIPLLMIRLFDEKYDEKNPNQFMTRVRIKDKNAKYIYALDNLSYKIVNFDDDKFKRFRKTPLWVNEKGEVVNYEKKIAIASFWNDATNQWCVERYSLKLMIGECFVPNNENYKFLWCPQSPSLRPKINSMRWCTKSEYAYLKYKYEKDEDDKKQIIKEEKQIIKDEKQKPLSFSQQQLREYIIKHDKNVKNPEYAYFSKIRILKEFKYRIYHESELSLDKLGYNVYEYPNLNNLVYSPLFDLYYDPMNQNIINTKDRYLYSLKQYEITMGATNKKLDKKTFISSLDFKGMDFENSIFDGSVSIKYRTDILYEATEEGIELIYNSNNRTEKSEKLIHRMVCIDWIRKNDKSIPQGDNIYFSPIKKKNENEPWVFENMEYSWREKPLSVKNLSGPYKIDSEGYIYHKENMMFKKVPMGIKTIKIGGKVCAIPEFKDIFIPTEDDKEWKAFYEDYKILCYVSKYGKVRSSIGEEILPCKKNGRDDYIKITPSIFRTLPFLMNCWHPEYNKYSYLPPFNEFITEGEYSFENLKNKQIFTPSKEEEESKIYIDNKKRDGNSKWYFFPKSQRFVSISNQGKRITLTNDSVYYNLGAETYYGLMCQNSNK